MSIRTIGDFLQFMPAVPAICSLYRGKYRQCGYILAAVAVNQLVIEVLKRVTRVQRPNGGNFKSFPSGHTQAAFLGAGLFLAQHGWKKSLPVFVGAIFTAFSRVYARKHWPTDVLAGAVFGLVLAKGTSILPGFSTPIR